MDATSVMDSTNSECAKISMSSNFPSSGTISNSSINTNNVQDNSYTGLESGPYLVCLSSKDKNLTHLHPMKIGKILYESGQFPNITRIKPQSRKQLALYFANHIEANAFVSSDICTKHNLQAFIPFSTTHCVGIIRGVSIDLSTEEILSNIQTDNSVVVTNIHRFNRKSVTDKDEVTYVPTQTCKITFRSTTLPRRVYLYHIACEVEKYHQPLLQCKNCMAFGHTAKFCRNNKKCGACSGDHSTMECDNLIHKCPNCSGPHKTRTPICEVYKRELLIQDKMNTLNLPRQEAKNIVYGKTTFAQLLTEKADTHPTSSFPSLRQEINSPTIPSVQLSHNTRHNVSQRTVSNQSKTDKAKKRRLDFSPIPRIEEHTNTRSLKSQRDRPTTPTPNLSVPNQHTPSQGHHLLPINEKKDSVTYKLATITKPMSEAKFLGTMNSLINEVPDHVRYQLEMLKQNQLWFYQHSND